MSVALTYEERGPHDAPALLLGSSLGATHAMWDAQVRALSGQVRTIAYDHRGHGGSPAPRGPYAIEELGRDVLSLMDDLALEYASYCGLSLGGMVGMWLAINAPERIDRLVLVCTTARMPSPDPWRERAAAVRAANSTEGVADQIVDRWLTPGYALTHADDRARLRAMLAGADPEGYASCCDAIAAMDQRPQLASISAPTLVIAGEQDPAIPPEHGEAIAAAVPGAQLLLLSPAAHLANVERSDEVSRAIADHLDLQELATQP